MVLASYKSDAEIEKLKDLVPHSDQMHKLIIDPSEKVDGTLKAANTLKELNKPDVCMVQSSTGVQSAEKMWDQVCEYYDKW